MMKNERFVAMAIPDVSLSGKSPRGTVKETEHLIAWFHDALQLLMTARRVEEPVLDISAWMDALLTLQVKGSLDEEILLLALRMQEMITQTLHLLGYRYDSQLRAYILKP